MANLDDAAVIRTACGEITSLTTVQTTGSATPPTEGWLPTSLGWHMGGGNIGCGYGSTYQHGDGLLLADFGRVEITGVTEVVDCCVKAMEYEGATMAQGGKAVRFDVLGGKCRIDREMMMKGNLDASTGKSMAYVAPCGLTNERYYWRHAAGGADGASLASAGSCAGRFNFTKVTSVDSFAPMGRLPEVGIEVPNHVEMCSDSAHAEYDVSKCQGGVVYNSITDPEACCEACVGLTSLNASTHADDTACVAFQIRNGRCQILREHFVTSQFGSAGLAAARPAAGGNIALSITETVEACVSGNEACLRDNNEHGHWTSCSETSPPSVADMCEYYSFLYFRDRLPGTSAFPVENATRTKPSYVSFDVFDPAELAGGMNITINATLVASRTGKNLTKAPISDASASGGYNLTVGDAASSAGYNATNPACVKIVLYESDPTTGTGFLQSVGTDGTYSMDPENTTVARAVVAESELCCPTADGGGCPLTLSFTEEQAADATTGIGRKLLAAASTGRALVVSYECQGTGGDVCDMQRLAYDVPNIGASPPPAAAANTADDTADDTVSAAAPTTASALVFAAVAGIAALAVHA